MGYEYEWDLNGVSNNSSASVVSGVVPIGPGKSPLTHKIMCIPKGSCSSFYISAPNVTREVVRLLYMTTRDKLGECNILECNSEGDTITL